jgi:hypothetical protein
MKNKKIVIKNINEKLDNLKKNLNMDLIKKNIGDIKEIDIIISSGAWKGVYFVGAYEILKYVFEELNIKIASIHSCSVGSFCGVYSLANPSIEKWIDLFIFYKSLSNKPLDKKKEIIDFFNNNISKDLYKNCNHTLNIYLSKINKNKKITQHCFNTFENNKNLINICIGSSTIPLITSSSLFYVYNKNRYIDGAFTNRVPIPNNINKKIIFDFLNLDFDYKQTYSGNNLNWEKIIIESAENMINFLYQKKDLKKKILFWESQYCIKEQKDTLVVESIRHLIEYFLKKT